MSNSSLVNYTKISPHKNSPRNHKIDTITIHCVVGQASVESLGNVFSGSRDVSANYGIGYDGKIGMYVEEKDRSWCSSSPSNDHRAITIEVASDTTAPYKVNDKAYAALINLVADICKRNGIKKLMWKNDKSLIGQVDKQNMTVHRWFASTACPGDYLMSKMGDIANKVNEKLGVNKSDITLYKKDGKWWYMPDGKTVDKTFVGLAKNEYGWWYVKNGTIDFTYNGTAKNQYGTWNVANGKVTTEYKPVSTTGIKTYTKAQANTKLSANFTVSEFAIKDVNYPCKVDMALIDKLQKIRNYFGQPVNITSGYRCTSYNAQIGGASNSYHTKGQAADMYISGLDPEFVGLYAQVVLGMKGIGIYHDDLFCHLDTRTSTFYWRNQSCTNQGSSFYGSYVSSKSNKHTIKALQTLLNRRGFNCGTVDGEYGDKTTAAVRAAQTKYKLTVDGLAGTQTLKALYGTKW